MRKLLAVALAVATMGGTFALPIKARADNGGFAAGLIGGLAAGAIIGSATAPRYYGPGYYYEPAPVYVAPPPPPAYAPSCYWTRGEPVWNGYRWVRPRVQVCD
ncbi:MAG TPA: hypothetical protein VEM36_07035 [Xanthobacteraceae bacterium]|nr:hypothetical protein [Xanthobacteraceae bacterium]